MSGWKGNLLNPAGKEILIKAVVQAIPTYTMSVLKLPKSFCQQIVSEVIRFWWSNNAHTRGIHWKRKELLCTPKAMGGMGFKDFMDMNLALLAKQAWRLIQDPHSYWASILKGIYFPQNSFWNAPTRRGSSWAWQSLLEGRNVLKQSGRWSIGSGQIVHVEEDNWLANGSKAILREGATVSRVSDLINEEHRWDNNVLRANLETPSAIAALQTPISWNSSSDTLFWPFTTTGEYSVKSGYRRVLEQRSQISTIPSTSTTIPEDLWMTIWNAKVPNKVKHFIWRVCHNALAVKQNLHQRRLLRSPMCPICETEPESVEHLLLLCNWTTPIWFGTGICPIPQQSSLTSFTAWLMGVRDLWLATNKDITIHLSQLFYYLWHIWKARNEKVFNDKHPNPIGTMLIAQGQCQEFLKAHISESRDIENRQRVSSTAHWRPTESGWIKINVDAAYEQQLGRGFPGWVCRDYRSKVLTAHTSFFLAPNALVAETFAVRDALNFARSMQMSLVVIESDCAELVDAIHQKITRKEIQSIIHDIQHISTSFQMCEFTWVNRELNRAAHEIARLRKLNLLHGAWVSSPPESLHTILFHDANGSQP